MTTTGPDGDAKPAGEVEPADDAQPWPGCRRFVGQVALLTAAGSGIGAATARRLAAEGAFVVVTDVDEAAAQRVRDEVRAAGGTAESARCDVTSPADWTASVELAVSAYGSLDVLHLNAGRNVAGPIGAISDESWDQQIGLSLRSAMLGVRACLPALSADPGGAVVVTSSIHARRGLRGYPAYAAAKGGLEALVRQLAVDYGPAVRFNAVAPGAIRTAMWDGATPEQLQGVADQTPMARVGEPADVAAAVAYLASADAAYVTGAVLVVDGGRTVAMSD